MKNLYVLCGIPGCGKSTFIEKHMVSFGGTTNVVSRDEIRFSLVAENEEYFSKETQVFEKFIEKIKDSLENYDNTIVDATHINKSSRSKLLNALNSSLKNDDILVNAIVLKVDLKTALDRNEGRTGRAYVPRGAIRRMFNQFTVPTCEEGFDLIYLYENDKIKKIIAKED